MDVRSFLKNNIVLLDGGMGTMLHSHGLQVGEYPERWNISHPDIIREIHKSYYDAGSNIVSTNTFGANALKFSDAELNEIISAAVACAKAARQETENTAPKFIALDIGPLGKLLKPFGDLDFEEAVSIFGKTVRIGEKCGVDLIFIETMNDSYETKAALLAAKENSTLPVFVSNAYSENGKLMTGATPAAMVALLEGMGADAIGVNCSLGPEQLSGVVAEYLKYSEVPVILKPNAGLPKCECGETVFDVSAEEFAISVAKQLKNGVRVAGGCCGTTPEYIFALKEKAVNITPKVIQKNNNTVVSSYCNAVFFDEKPVLIGERINPTGKKRFKMALLENDMDYILQEGLKQQSRGVDILDVNVGLPDIDEAKTLKRTVTELQALTKLPLQIDTSDVYAMESALRVYNGKPLINSVNGKAENMAAIFPLQKKYGGVVVALTLDEGGIPATAKERVKIAKKILNTAKEYGIHKKDIIFDPLAMAVSADPDSAKETLEAVRIIENELNCKTSLGVSNISFGLPQRDIINSVFFAAALQNGLSAAIMNPYSDEMMKVYHAHNALHGLDDNFSSYISFAEALNTPAADVIIKTDTVTDLKTAIVKGLKEQAAKLSREMLATVTPIDIINREIIPALDSVGIGFEKGSIYLPQLLISAEAAKSAFSEIKAAVPQGSGEKCNFVIATVEGDIHDIGKNIVKLLLENYGFNVHDLGKDVPAEIIVEEIIKTKAAVAGLSALMTTTVPSMEKTIKLIREKAPWCRVIVGGAVLNADYAQKIGADYYAKDAMEAVRFAEKLG